MDEDPSSKQSSSSRSRASAFKSSRKFSLRLSSSCNSSPSKRYQEPHLRNLRRKTSSLAPESTEHCTSKGMDLELLNLGWGPLGLEPGDLPSPRRKVKLQVVWRLVPRFSRASSTRRRTSAASIRMASSAALPSVPGLEDSKPFKGVVSCSVKAKSTRSSYSSSWAMVRALSCRRGASWPSIELTSLDKAAHSIAALCSASSGRSATR
mmetsp:Transcript_9580/g.21270  ORF Transcript_9580/g.21270 Transcript_9580/m.21270 type:complete len:208 (+) Transcript_9580:431-1054(+)